MPSESQKDTALTNDEQRQLRALLYVLTPVEMLEVVTEVIKRQQENEKYARTTTD